MQPEIHTICVTDDNWVNRDETGATLSRHTLKMDAVAQGRELAATRSAVYVVHMRDGSVGSRLDRRRDAA